MNVYYKDYRIKMYIMQYLEIIEKVMNNYEKYIKSIQKYKIV